jgi:hypothetical protein
MHLVESRLNSGTAWFVYLATAVCLLFALNSLIVPLAEIPLHVIKNTNEGWNAYFIDRAMNGSGLYPLPPAMIVDNYPPLSFYITGWVGRIVGDPIIAGRLLSVVAYVISAVLLGAIVGARTASWPVGLFAGAYFAAVFSVFPGGRIGLNDPQLLGHAVMLGGLAVLWLGDGRFRTLAAAAALMVAAGLIKHNLVALPVAATLWIAMVDRRKLILWLAAVLLAGVAAIVLLLSVWGLGSLSSILTPRMTSLGKAAGLILLLRGLAAQLAIALLLWFRPRLGAAKDATFCAVYVVLSVVLGFLAYAGEGVSANAAFDVAISVVLAIGVLLGSLPSGREKMGVIAALVVAQLLMVTSGVGTLVSGAIAREEQTAAGDIAYVASHPGPAICSDPTICYWAGKEFVFDFFNMVQLFSLDRRDPAPLLDKLRHHDISVIVISGGLPRTSTKWSADFVRVLDDSYRIDRRSEDRVFYVPKGEN